MDNGQLTLESMSIAPQYNKWILKKFAKYLKGDILEIGSGIGNFTKLLVKYGDVWASDVSKNYLSKIKEEIPEVKGVGVADIEQGKYSEALSDYDLELKIHEQKVFNLTERLPALPNFSYFHKKFRSAQTPEGNIREAYFLAYDEELYEHLKIEECEIQMNKGRELVSASFVIPYPPGFPILVPGQVMTKDILEFMKALDVKEIHSYNAELGLRVFTKQSLK